MKFLIALGISTVFTMTVVMRSRFSLTSIPVKLSSDQKH